MGLLKFLFAQRKRPLLALITLCLIATVHFYLNYDNLVFKYKKLGNQKLNKSALPVKQLYDSEGIRQFPLIFIGGYARSGTTLMRAILGVHDSVSCGPETKIIPDMLKYHESEILQNERNQEELASAGLSKAKINNALRFYLFSLMNEHVRAAERLCAKDPETLHFMIFLGELFPKAKFVAMVRDPRAVVYSLMNVLHETMDMNNVKKFLITWDQYYRKFRKNCEKIGPERCLIVKYESLILNTNGTMRRVAKFLDLEWTDNFLRHHTFVGDRVQISDTEWSSDQIKKPIYQDALMNWAGKLEFEPGLVERKAHVLKQLGYDLKHADFSYLKDG